MITSASFFWRNDEPDGLGISFRPPQFTPAELTEMFSGDVVRQYFADSDACLGDGLVSSYLDQLAAIAAEAKRRPLPLAKAILAALNILYLTDRGCVFQPIVDAISG